MNGGEKMSNKIIKVYDIASGKYVDVEVSEKLAAEYKRTKWAIENNDSTFFKHEIQFSALIGGNDKAFENFREFKNEYSVEEKADHIMLVKRLYDCLIFLPKNERRLIEMLYFENKTEQECAEILCMTQQNVNKIRRNILCKMQKFLRNL